MKLIFKISIISLSALMMNSSAFSQSANGSSSSEQTAEYAQAGISGALGGFMIKSGMSQVTQGNQMISTAGFNSAEAAAGAAMVSQGHIQEFMGAAMVTAGLGDLASAGGRSADIDPTAAGSGDLGTGNNGFQNVPVPAAVQSALNSGIQAANAAGINPSDPASVAAAGDAAGLDGSADGLSAGLAKLSPENLAALEKEKQALMNQFHVSSVGTEGGGGGRVAKGNKSDDGLAELLAGLGDKKDRGPASVEGLSKMFNGDAIGVAGDNIFKQVSRRYQTKIQQKKFLLAN